MVVMRKVEGREGHECRKRSWVSSDIVSRSSVAKMPGVSMSMSWVVVRKRWKKRDFHKSRQEEKKEEVARVEWWPSPDSRGVAARGGFEP